MRHINSEALDLIRRWEGLRLSAYLCAAGIWTIGYGHTTGVKPGDTITEAQATALLQADLRVAEAAVQNMVHVPLSDGQFGALVSFTFNVGQGALGRSTLLRRLNAGDYDAVPAELARWNRAAGRVVQGLSNRRAAEAGLWARGGYVSSNHVGAQSARRPPDATAGAAGGALATGVIAVIAEHAGALAPLISALRDIQPLVVLILIAALAATAFTIWKLRRHT